MKLLANASKNTNEDIEKFNALRQQIVDSYPELANAIGKEVQDVGELAGAYQNVIDAIEGVSLAKAIELQEEASRNRTSNKISYGSGYEMLHGGSIAFQEGLNVGTAKNALYGNADSVNKYVKDIKGKDQTNWAAGIYRQLIDETQAALYEATANNIYDTELTGSLDSFIRYLNEKLAQKEEEATEKVRSSLIGFVTASMDPIKYKGNLKEMGSIRESIVDVMLEEALSGNLGNPEARAAELAKEVEDWIANIQQNVIPNKINDIDKYAFDVDKFITEPLMHQLEVTAPIQFSDSFISYLLDPYFEAIGKSADEYFAEHNPLLSALSNAQKDIDSMLTWGKLDDAQGRVGASRIGGIITELLDLGATTGQIEDILIPFFKRIGTASDEFWNNLKIVRSDEVNDIARGAASAAFGESLDEAMAYLDQIENIQETIDNLRKNGLTGDNVSALEAILGLDRFEEMWQEALEGDLGIDAFIQALYDEIASVREEMGENPLTALLGAPSDDQIQEAVSKIASASTIDELRKVWGGLTDSVKDAIRESYSEIDDLINSTEERAEDSAEAIGKAVEKIRRNMDIESGVKSGAYWEDLADILDDVAEGGSKVSEAFADVNDRVNDAAEAIGALEAAQNGDADALAYLADLTGITAEMLGNDLTPAEYVVAEATDQATNSLTYLANMLYTANAITIDDSGKIVPLDNIRAAAEAAGMTLAQLSTAIAQMNGASVTWATTANGMQLKASVKPVTWSGAKSTSSRSSGGGRSGGGGGGGSMKVSDSVTNLLEDISAKKALEDYRRELAQLAQSYYKETGELQGVILYLGIERDVVNENTKKIEEYIAQIEAEIEARRSVIASEKEGSTAYKQAAMDLEKLQEDHQKYSKELLKNKTDVEALTKAIKEQQDAIRQMEIDLHNTVLKAIEDREAAEEKMLDGRIAMENEIFDILKERYEKERDEILETENAKKAALQAEISRIDELLNERKKLAEQEDKMQQIADLEEKIARISADPTRQKEAATMRQQIAKLREDMAWDQAEAEADAQKKSLEQQVKSLDDYVEYVNGYYEDLFKNPQKLMEEMKQILEGTDDEIISWLKQNTESYETSTEAAQKKMVKSWQDTLDQMRDTIRTHWDEVEEIIAGGDENIITFLQTYTEEYRKAGKLQAEAYTEEWKKQLEDLDKARKKVTGGINSYDYVDTNLAASGSGSGGGGGGSSGGGGSGSSSGSSTTTTTPKAGSHKYGYKNANGKWVEVSGTTDTLAFAAVKAAALSHYQKSTTLNEIEKAVIIGQLQNATKSNLGSYLKKYAAGGLNTSTGLAWLDGTPTRPERILSAYQTELFEDLIGTLHTIRKMSINTMTGSPRFKSMNQMPNIDTINVTVEHLNDDTDYGEAAEKMMNEFYKKLARTRPVGGIQGW